MVSRKKTYQNGQGKQASTQAHTQIKLYNHFYHDERVIHSVQPSMHPSSVFV